MSRAPIKDYDEILEVMNKYVEGSIQYLYSDFQQLLKINGEWKVIAKLFHRHN
ncbi:nuclear transport factor 2 family protein [Brevibacillus brevis]|uniref:Nuclear transport factor 2 family protein n=1 Tax=Brevibacillus brevis TaxID=1393 RepID=A0A517I5K0_BREBE|nr:nuclear transport factor 2 family protein [Brevibacillus brevis]QDS34179.1 nuclear transport factor 2 family protein [Brevibacillus brevis]